ncbi:MAG: permease prefix domain 2-containing transporter [Bacteroidota bacterium]
MTHPPKWATKLLHWFCDPELLEDLEGDLLEIFHQRVRHSGLTIARRQYAWLVVRSIRPSALKSNQKLKNSRNTMFFSNIKIAWRVWTSDGFNTSINLLGLIVGIFSFLLLGQYVTHERSFDEFHQRKDRIYRALLREDYGEGKVFFNATTPLRFESLLEDHFPEVEAAVQFMPESYLIGEGQDRISEKVAIISADFLRVFDFEVKKGQPERLLNRLDDVILSERFAKKYFGEEEAMGQSFTIQIGEEKRRFTVNGIIKDIPTNSSIQFDIAISAANTRSIYGDGAHSAWFSIIPETYMLLKDGASINEVNEKMQDVVLSQMGDASYGGRAIDRDQYNIDLQPLTDIHLDPSVPLGYAPVSNPQYVLILAAIGWLVLLAACINYTSIATGQSLQRSRAVGIRKALGAHRGQLLVQHLTESTLLSLVAMMIAFVASYLLVPIFNKLLGIEIPWIFYGHHLVIALLAGFIAGIYPAFLTSKSAAIEVLHTQRKQLGKLFFRKAIMVVQFAVTVFLITSTLIMRDQLNFLMSKDLGFNYEAKLATQLVADPASEGLSDYITSSMSNGAILKSKLEQYPEVKQIAMGTHVFGTPGWGRLAYTDEHNVFRRFTLLVVDAHYLDLFQIDIAAGRGFLVGNGLDLPPYRSGRDPDSEHRLPIA